MTFKIVKTYENNKEKLFVVPSLWENKNILKWPRKNEAKHLKNKSTPEADWKHLKCVVKRQNIPSYETAEYVLKEMLNHTDTEDTDSQTQITKQISGKPLRELNLNIIADEIVHPAASGSNNFTNEMPAESRSNNIIVEMPTASRSNNATSEIPAALSGGMDNVYEYHIIQDNQIRTDQHQCCTNFGQNLEIQNAILSNQTQILNELQNIKNVQNIIIQKVAVFSVQLDDAVSQITSVTDSNFQVTMLNETRSTPCNTAFSVKPVNNIHELNELEQQLSDSSIRQKMKNTYSVLCNGGKGIDCAYTLADILFSRDFLCECTWSGGSRGSDTKIAWKSFKHILSFFWEMVHFWDKTYTIDDNQMFFKNILKNAKKRKMAKNQRASTSRKRPKLSKVENVFDTETSDEDTSNETNNDTDSKENPVTDKKKEQGVEKESDIFEENRIKENYLKEDQEAEAESDIVEESPITANNPEKKDQEVDKEKKNEEENKMHSDNISDYGKEVDKEEKNEEENKMHSDNISDYGKSNIDEENIKTAKNIECKILDGTENCITESKNYFVPNETNNEADNIEKVTIDTKNNQEDDAAGNKRSTLSKSQIKKIVKMSKKKRNKLYLSKQKKNCPISHKNVSG